MKCLLSYKWVKLRRSHLPAGKGIMGAWLRLAAKAAFRNGQGKYCGYVNDVIAGSWVGGIVGLKSILGIHDRKRTLAIMDELMALGYINYQLDAKTKKLVYHINDWVVECSGTPCLGQAAYATDGFGFLCIPRTITERLVERGYVMDETDAWLDLWCHTVWQEKSNPFSGLAPAVQFERSSPVLTLEALGKRWHWEKTKVWRFFQKYSEDFSLIKLPGAFGCLIYTSQYPTSYGSIELPEQARIVLILNKIRILAQNTHFGGSDNRRINAMIAAYCRELSIGNLNEGLPSSLHPTSGCRVALPRPYYIHAYFSQAQYCQSCYLCSLDCCRSYSVKPNKTRNQGSGIPPGPHLRKEEQNVRHNNQAI